MKEPSADYLHAIDSADAWGELGRNAARKAQEATDRVRFGTAEVYRTCAAQAFEFELKLREQASRSVGSVGNT